MANTPVFRSIYRLVHPISSDTFYVGATKRIKSRLQRHIWDAKHRHRTALHPYLLELLEQGLQPVIESLEEVSGDDWIIAEQKWIKHYRDQGATLFNLSAGGYPATDPVPESRERMSRSHQNYRPTPESNLKRSESLRGELNHFFGKHHTAETKAKISAKRTGVPSPKKGKPAPEAGIAKRRLAYIVTDPHGNETHVTNLRQFCEQHGLQRGNMASVAVGKLKHSQGWKCRHA